MTYEDAKEMSERMNKPGLSVIPVRILPEHIDPPRSGDNGWDVLVTVVFPEEGELA